MLIYKGYLHKNMHRPRIAVRVSAPACDSFITYVFHVFCGYIIRCDDLMDARNLP